ncbi:MAG: hypothetical protein Q9180_000085 [Flavoplaca navasiana]
MVLPNMPFHCIHPYWLLDYIGVKSSASQDEIVKAYRKKSKAMHPDKAKQAFIASRAKPPSKKPGEKVKKPGVHVSKPPSDKEIRDAVKRASERYARLGVIAEILKGGGRERYNYFLANGFPRWRGTGYYYARFRPGLGSVLVGLFIMGGGLAHYGALYVSWKRQKEFVERYVRHARKTAWGNDSSVAGIPGIDGAAETTQFSLADGAALNRRQKRQQERESRKEDKAFKSKSKAIRRSGTSTPVETDPIGESQGPRKKIQAENGKTLIVDSVGNVFLEEEDEDGEKQEYLLDPDEIKKPTIRQTLLFKLPIWTYGKMKSAILGQSESSNTVDADADNMSNGPVLERDSIEHTNSGANGSSRKRGKRNGKVDR